MSEDMNELEFDSAGSTDEEFEDFFADDSEESNVPEEDHKAGLRQADYTRKTQELAALRKEVEAERASARDALLFVEAIKNNPKLSKALAAATTAQAEDEDEDWRDPAEVKAEMASRKADEALRELRSQKLDSQLELALSKHPDLSGKTKLDLVEFMRSNDMGKPEVAAKYFAAEVRAEARKFSNSKTTDTKRQSNVAPGGASRRASERQVSTSTFEESWASALAELNLDPKSPLF